MSLNRKKEAKSAPEELRAIRRIYDGLELSGMRVGETEGESWKNWKRIRNVISDRLEEITGSRE